MKRYFIHTGLFASDPVRIVWWEHDPPDENGMSFSSVLKAFPVRYKDIQLAIARAEQLNTFDIPPEELMKIYTHLHTTGAILDLTGRMIDDIKTDLEFFGLIEHLIHKRGEFEYGDDQRNTERQRTNQETIGDD